MMNRGIVLLFFILFSGGFCHSQNLVLNNEFEDTTFCPSGLDQTSAATGWRSYRGTPDYFNTCSSSIFANAPSSFFGYQVPASGNAYASFYAYYTSYPDYRELIGSTLSDSLVAGTKYFVSFKVALANSHDYSRVCNNLGIKFTNWDYWSGYPAPINNSAHYYSTAMISDTANWTMISGSFIADSNYTRVMIGNFFDDASTTNSGDATQYGAYYFLDDLCVSTDSAFCYNYVGISENKLPSHASFYPNPFSDYSILNVNQELKNGKLILYDLTGKEVRVINFSGNTTTLIRENLVTGIYFYRIVSENKFISRGKLLVE